MEAKTQVSLSVNGVTEWVSVAPATPLLFVLRNELKLTGPRLDCGMAQCGLPTCWVSRWRKS